jgi:hypothetical protein
MKQPSYDPFSEYKENLLVEDLEELKAFLQILKGRNRICCRCLCLYFWQWQALLSV